MNKKWELEHLIFHSKKTISEDSAPDWLTSKNTIKGSTMDDRWFWEDYVKQLKIGQSIETDFHRITRVE